MKWTTEKPKEPGWYWVRWKDRVVIDRWVKDRVVIDRWVFINDKGAVFPVNHILHSDMQFSSEPIPFPEEQ